MGVQAQGCRGPLTHRKTDLGGGIRVDIEHRKPRNTRHRHGAVAQLHAENLIEVRDGVGADQQDPLALVGVLVALALFAKRRGRRVADVFDFAAALPGIGILAVRVGNFINGELWGRPGDVPWAMLVDGVARHPTQLYEALLEGALLAAVLWWFTSKPRPQWAPAGLFLIMYSSGRLIVEFWRLPDAHIGYLAGGWLTMGHVLTLPMLLAGVALLLMAYRRNVPSGNRTTA